MCRWSSWVTSPRTGRSPGPRPSSTWWTSSSRSRAIGPVACASSARRRTGTGPPRRWASSRWGTGGSSRSPTPPARSSPSTMPRPRGAWWRPCWRARGRSSSRSRRSWRRPGRPRRVARPPAWTRTASRSSSPSSAAGRGRGWERTTSTPTSPAGSPSPSPAWTCRSHSRSPPRCVTGRSCPGRWRSARWVSSASCAPWADWTGGCARPRASGSRARSRLGPAGARARVSPGIEVVEVGSLADAIRAALTEARAGDRER